MKKSIGLALILALVFTGVALADAYDSGDKILESGDHTLAWTGQGVTDGELDTEICPSEDELPDGVDPNSYLHFIFNTDGGTAVADNATPTLTLGGSGSGTYLWFKKNPGDSTFHFYVPFFDLNTLTAYVSFTTNNTGTGAWQLTISHGCAGFVPKGDVKVTKTAYTTYTREHFWDIAKKVETDYGYEHEGYPKIWLYIDGSKDETATWTVDVTYKGYTDKNFAVYGDIKIENTGNIPARVDDVDDYIETSADIAATVVCPTLPVMLLPGEKLECTYSSALPNKTEGTNFANASGLFLYPDVEEFGTFNEGDTADVKFGDPTIEINKTIHVKDISDLYDEVALGTVTAPNNAQFTYTKDFAWEDYGQEFCGDYIYENTATIVETGQSASATLKVNVQCYIYETAYAMGDNASCFIPTFSQWGWTNPILPNTYVWPLYAGAAQCDISKGTWVGTVTVVYGADGYVTVTYNVDSPYIVKETHVYADYGKFPLFKGKPTVAPGQYYNASPFDGNQVYVIAHAVVGIPDPNFGP